MSEDKGELTKNSPSELQTASDTPPDPSTALSRVEERLAKATTPEEVVLWTRIRGEIVRQNEIIKNGEQRRFLEKIQIVRKLGLSVGALTIGTVLISSGLIYPGLLILGAGLYDLAPDLLKEALGGGKGKNDSK